MDRARSTIIDQVRDPPVSAVQLPQTRFTRARPERTVVLQAIRIRRTEGFRRRSELTGGIEGSFGMGQPGTEEQLDSP
jgi:hypothetical protein